MVRIERVNQLMKREVSSMIQRDIQDPRLEFVTITNVVVSKDLRYAKISFSVLGPGERIRAAQDALDGARGFVRKLVGQRVRMRYTPEIEFVYDRSLEYSARIEEALNEIKKQVEKSQ